MLNHRVRFPVPTALLMLVPALLVAACTGAGATPALTPKTDSTLDQSASTSPFTREELLRKMVSSVPKDAIPAILDPRFVPARDVPQLFRDEELVIGVLINGDARAYPIDILSHHEIVNDVVGGIPIAVTW